MSSAPKAPPPPERVDPGASAMSYLFGQGSGQYEGMGVASPEVQQAILEAERTYGPEYVRNQLARSEFGLFGDENTTGLLEQSRRGAEITESMRAETASSQRESDISDVERLGGRAVQANRSADADQASLMAQERGLVDELFSRAQGVTAQQNRMAQQGSREAYGDRGRQMGNTSIFGEALGREDYMRQNRAEAFAGAGQLFGQYQATGGDPFQAILGRPSSSLGLNANASQQALGLDTTSQTFNADAGINLAMQENANQADFDANIYGADSARHGAIMGGLFQGIGSAVGGFGE